ncbi:DUF6415 family natural product biosynthesis protein [Streptomyces sp. NPDC088560]|uniref:DUF6415 family natural product biosynthesis protein n=1 Tax=Streptomyces sp. NPDC088560 TaxID=3365868 RepID=UPI00382E3EE5
MYSSSTRPREAEPGPGTKGEPARRAAPRTMLDLLGALSAARLDDYLDLVLAWGAAPLRPDEVPKIVSCLRGCLWGLVTQALNRVDGCPDRDLVKRISFAVLLHDEGAVEGFRASDAYVRRLAMLISDLLDRVAEDDDSPLPTFNPQPAFRGWWSA